MRTIEATDFFCSSLNVARGTVAARIVSLQAEGLFARGSRGRNSGVDLSSTDCTNALLALALEPSRGESVTPIVRRVRGLFHDEPPAVLPFDFAKGLTCFEAVTAGEAIDGAIDDFRTGRFDAWANGEDFTLNVTLTNQIGDGVLISASKPRRQAADVRSIVAGYGLLPPEGKRPLVERTLSVRRDWFRQLAERMGPPAPT